MGLEAQTKWGNLELVESYAKFRLRSTSPMLCTPLNIIDPFLQDNAIGILEIDEGKLEASRWV